MTYLTSAALALAFALGGGCLSFGQPPNWRSFESGLLGRDVEYAVHAAGDPAPTGVVYITDGRKWAERGLLNYLDSLHSTHTALPPTTYVLVSTIDPATGEDVRERFFDCDGPGARFFTEEFVPHVERDRPLASAAASRVLVGASFGAMSAAALSAEPDSPFGVYVLLSPITFQCPGLLERIAFLEGAAAKTRRAFVTTGTHDAEVYAEPLAAMYAAVGVEAHYVHTEGGHEFATWFAVLGDALAWALETR